MGKTIIIVLVVIGIVLLSGFAYARYQGFYHGPEGKANWLMERVTKQLELDDQQQQQLGKFRDKVLSLKDSMQSERPQHIDEALKLLDTPQLDRNQAYQLWEVKHNWVAAAGPQLIDAFADFTDSLNGQQRSKLLEMINWHRQHRHSHCCGSRKEAFQE